MRILVSAIACHPEWGSESAVGWKTALALAKSHEVHVLTSSENREGIEQFLCTRGIANPSFAYFGATGPYHANRLIARAQSWLRYVGWMRRSLAEARAVLGKRHFDLVHHVTYSTCRVASPLWQLGLPFVFGPIGGGEEIPWVAVGSMSRGQRLHEVVRLVANKMMNFSCRLRRTVRNSSALIASNQATSQTLRRLGADPGKIVILPVVFFTEETIAQITSRPKAYGHAQNHLTIFSSGMLEGRKGLAIALHAVRVAADSGLNVSFTIPSRGPEFSYLRSLTYRLGISDMVHFPESLPRGQYWEQLLSADIYMAPSLRDNCPATLLEAMLCRCVPIVANCNGPGEIVSHETGELIEPAKPQGMAAEIARKLLELAHDRAEMARKAEAASRHVATAFTEAHYLQTIDAVYRKTTCR